MCMPITDHQTIRHHTRTPENPRSPLRPPAARQCRSRIPQSAHRAHAGGMQAWHVRYTYNLLTYLTVTIGRWQTRLKLATKTARWPDVTGCPE